MRSTSGISVSVEQIGALVEIAVGPSAVKMTPEEVEEMIAAMRQAVDEARKPRRRETVH